MSKEKRAEKTMTWTCPTCGEPLATQGDLLRCAKHGEFFIYGPRLLVRVPRQGVAAPLMPWQTMQENVVG